MVKKTTRSPLHGELLGDSIELTLAQLCRACQLPAERIFEFIDEGIVEPRGRDPKSWRFHSLSIRRVRRAQRLKHDLGVNTPGVALALELLEELEVLRARMQQLHDRGIN